MKFFLVSIAILALGSSYYYYLEYAEKKRNEKLHSTVLSYCKKIGFDNRDSKVHKSQRSYANCFSFLTSNKTLY